MYTHTCRHIRAHIPTYAQTHAHTYTYAHVSTYTLHTQKVPYTYAKEKCICTQIQAGKDPQDAFNCRSFFAKEPLIIGLLCGKLPIKIRHPMGLRHPVLWAVMSSLVHVCVYEFVCVCV